MKTLRYAVIGIGNMGSAHARALYENKIENASLVCVVDTDERRRDWALEAFRGKVEVCEDYREVLDPEKVDAVIIATPHYSHTVIAVEAFKAGLHVMVEKPAGVDASEVKAMNRAAARSGKAFGIMFNQRTTPLFSTLKYYVEIGLLGDIKRFNWIINNWYRTQAYYSSAGWRASWNGEGGGVLLNQCPHNLDLWQWIMGMPQKLQAFCKEGKYHRISVEDDVTIYAEYKNGATATFITSTGEYPGTNRIEISGTMGKAVAEDGVLKLYLLDEDERDIRFGSLEAMPTEKVTEIKIEFPEIEDGHILILRNFTNHILTGEDLTAPGEEGIKSLQISNAAYASSWTEMGVNVPVDEILFSGLLKQKCMTEKKNAGKVQPEAEKATGTYSNRWSVRW